MERILSLLLLVIVMMFSFINNSFAGYTGPTLKLPMQPGNSILCTVEAGGRVAPVIGGGTDTWHTDVENGYYALDFDDRYEGDYVVAAAAGSITTVVNSGCSNGGTACEVKIDHGGGYVTTYYHLKNGSVPTDVYVGTNVQQGQVIGIIGSTGEYSTGPHLHFSIKYNGDGYSYTDQLSGVELDGIPFVDYNAGSSYQSSNDGTPTCSTTTSSNAVHLMTVEPQSNGKYAIYGYQLSGSGNSATLSGNYWSYQNTGNQTTTFAWLSGDVNGDGYDDVVQTRYKSGYTYAQVYLSGGTGGLNTQTQWKQTSGQATKAFLADMNDDHTADLILGFPNSDSTMTWKYYTSDGSTRFEDAVTWNTSFGKESDVFVVGDFNGNGKAELLRGRESDGSTGSNFSSPLIWKRLDTSGNDSTVLSSFGYSGDDWFVINVDNDSDSEGYGTDELVRIDRDDSTVVPYVATYNTSSQTFNTPTSYANDVGGPEAEYFVYAIDYLDGYPDLMRFDGSDLKLMQSSGGTAFEEQGNQSTLVSGINTNATFLFGDYGDSTSTSESCVSATSLDGDIVDPIDEEEEDTSAWDYGWTYSSLDLTSQANVDYADLSSSPSCAVDAADSLYVVLNGQDNRIYELESTDDGTTWTSTHLTSTVSVPYSAEGTSPHLLIDPDTGDRYVSFVGTNARINLFHFNGTSWSAVELTSVVAAPLADTTSSPMSYIAQGIVYVVYQGSDQRIWRFSVAGTSYGSEDLTGKAAVEYAMVGTSPQAVYNDLTGEHHIVFQGINQRIQRLTYNGSSWSSVEITSVIDSDLLDPDSQPFTYVDPVTSYVYTVINGENERIDLIGDYHDNSWGSAELTSLVSVPLTQPGTSPTGYIDPSTGNHVITFQGDNERINQFEGSSWTSIDLTSQAAVEYAATGTSPATCVDPFTGVRHMVFVGDNGRIQYIRYGP